MKLNDLSYDEIEIGQVFSFRRMLTEKDVDDFANISGDHNPLHCDDDYAKTTKFGARVSHGMLAASLFSALVGMLCPGKRALYLSQTLNFRMPIPLNKEVEVVGKVKEKADSIKVITIETRVMLDNKPAVTGEAKVRVLGD